ncbi:MAG: enoyl-CoA hydratase/isomerase family protein [Planctomycetes bacterium]|nr:enoyl-CoA hydratase/isomerase family protein [Planctomycetota bacterium]
MIELTIESGVRVMRMTHGKANALDLEFCTALADAFRAEAVESAPLVITGSGRIFSAGVDLPRVLAEGDDYTAAFLGALDDCFMRLFELQKPVVAAVNGHAIAGGCILAAACDVALMVDTGATIGVPELAVGVPFPPLPLEILRQAVGTSAARHLAFSCENVSADRAFQLGLVSRLTTAETLMLESIKDASRMGSMPRASFALTKQQLRLPATQMLAALKKHADDVAAEWRSPQVKEAIQQFVDSTLKRRN